MRPFVEGLVAGIVVGLLGWGLVLHLQQRRELAAWRSFALAQVEQPACSAAVFDGRAYEVGATPPDLRVRDSVLRIKRTNEDPVEVRFDYGPTGSVRHLRVGR